MKLKKAFWIGIGLWLLYIASRFLIQRLFPVSTWFDFIRQDIYLTGFRLLLLYLIWDLARTSVSKKELGFEKGPLLLPAVVGILMVGIDFIRLCNNATVQAKPVYFVVEAMINLLIATNEEISFRGLFYESLKEMKNEKWAIYLGSFLFTLMHWGYQPFTSFPLIFILGLTFAFLRSVGVSLTVLIFIHWLTDYLVFIYPPVHNTFPEQLYTVMLLIPLGTAYYWGYHQKAQDNK